MIRAHHEGRMLTVDVVGPATMMESTAVSDLSGEQIAHGVRTVRIDLRDCTTMDSTFTGMLLALKRQLESAGGELKLVSPSDRVREELEQMGVDDFYTVERADRDDGPWSVVVPSRARTERLKKIVIEAHDELAQLPGPAGRAFRSVADELRRDETQEASGPETMRTAALGRSTSLRLD
jgi:anti-anti-sigma factor